MKGIILAGGKGTRLYPMTIAVGKPLLPIYDKPMIYYPLSILMMADIRDILIISNPQDLSSLKNLLKDGSQLGVKISYKVQEQPNGIAEAFILGEEFIGNDECCLILGDNIFYGAGLIDKLKQSKYLAEKGICNIYGYSVNDPQRFGIMELDSSNNVLSIEEKPLNPKSNYCVTGLYFYPKHVSQKAKLLKPSGRSELEITDLNNLYLEESNIKATLLGRGYSWFDTGTADSLLEASNYIKMVENHQAVQICCPEEIAFNNNWINSCDILSNFNNSYIKYIKDIINK